MILWIVKNCTVQSIKLFLVFGFKNSFNLILFTKFIKFVYKVKTNKDKSTEIFPPLLLKPTDICTRAMPRAKKVSKRFKF